MEATVKLRTATIDDVSRINAQGERVWLHAKDFFLNHNGNIEVYKVDPNNRQSLTRIKAALDQQQLMVLSQD
jgi:hypothetical protein